MKSEAELNREKEFSRTLAKTLDNSLADIDELSLQRLKNARVTVLSQTAQGKFTSSNVVRFSAAATLLMLVAIPVLWQQHSAQPFSDADAEIVFQEVLPAAQELDDIDMLIAMDDVDA